MSEISAANWSRAEPSAPACPTSALCILINAGSLTLNSLMSAAMAGVLFKSSFCVALLRAELHLPWEISTPFLLWALATSRKPSWKSFKVSFREATLATRLETCLVSSIDLV